MMSTLTKITKGSFNSCLTVCETRCLLFMDQGYFKEGGPSNLSCCIGSFFAPLSILIAASFSSPIRGWLALTDIVLHQLHASRCGNIPTSLSLHPALYNVYFFLFSFFLLWRSGMKKEQRWDEGGGGEGALQLQLAVLATTAVNRSTASETVERASSVATRLMKGVGGGQNDRRTDGGQEEGTVMMDWSGAWLVWMREKDERMGVEEREQLRNANTHE